MEPTNQSVNMEDEVYETRANFSENIESAKKQISFVWKYFSRTGKDKDGCEKAICNYCEKDYMIGKNPKTKTNYGTSHLSRHISVCKGILNFDINVDDVLSNKTFSAAKINQRMHRDLLAQAIIQHDLPFNFVEYEKIREWVKYLNPNVVMHSRNTVVSDVRKIYNREKDKLKQILSKIPNRVCLTSDVWTASTTEGYIFLTTHFMDDKWNLVSKILNFCRMKPPHTGFELEAVLFDCLKHWGIDKKLFSITLDNASANDSMQDILRAHPCLQNSLLCDGEFFHVRCSTHILNLIAQEGLKVTNDALYKIRESVKYVRGSDGRMIKFKGRVQEVGIDTSHGLRLDVSTRWNSTYLMLESALKYEKAFDILRVTDTNYKYCPSDEEWRRGEKMCEFLEPFYETTNMISGSSYSTSNLYFLQVWKIQCLLDENLFNDDVVIKEMCERMKKKFDKYWKEYSVVLAFGAILDPRLKLDFILFCDTKLDQSTSEAKVKCVREKFEKLYREYMNNFNTPSVSQSQSFNDYSMLDKSSEEGSKSKRSKVFKEFKKFQNETKSTIGKSKLDVYLEEEPLDYDDNENLDVLSYWKINKKRFSTLAIMARDVLSIPITTVTSESAFSIGGRVLTKYRSSTLPDNVQMLICTRNWLHCFSLDPNDEDECKTIRHGTTIAELNVHQHETEDQ